jgi:hypothetical protein
MLARASLVTCAALFFAGCATGPARTKSVLSLSGELATLERSVSPWEAQRAAECAYATAADLTRQYRVVRPALLQNFLVNTGLRQRGLCFHWTEDLVSRLQALQLKTLEIHWACARAGTLREHNCVVLTARHQPFEQGIVLDSWRYGGRLYWGAVKADHYPWREDNSNYARARLAAAIRSNER